MTTTTPRRTPGPASRVLRTLRRPAAPRSTLLRHLLLVAAAFAGVVLATESLDPFRVSQLAALAYYATAAAGLTVLTGLNGQVSLGHGALMAIGAYTTALLLERAVALPLVLVLAVVVTATAGVAVGAAAARLHGPYLAGATLALAVGLPGVLVFLDGVTGGEQGLRVATPQPPDVVADVAFFVTGQELTTVKYVTYVGWSCLLLTLLVLANLVTTRPGRIWRAVRDDEVTARLAGIDVGRARVLAFVVSAACAGLAGAVLALAVRLAAPSAFSVVLSLALLTAVVLGGLGSLVGALLGSALLVFLPQAVTSLGSAAGLSDVRSAQLAPLVYGAVLVLTVLVAPRGVVGSLRTLRLRRSGAGPRPDVASGRTEEES